MSSPFVLSLGLALALVAVLVALASIAVKRRLTDRLTFAEMVNATGEADLEPYCKAASHKIEAEILARLDEERRWMSANAEFMGGLELAPCLKGVDCEDLDAGLEALAESVSSAIPSGLAGGLRLVSRQVQQRGATVTSLLEFGPPGVPQPVGIMVQVSQIHGWPKKKEMRFRTFWESPPDGESSLRTRVEALMVPALWWATAELTRGLLRTQERAKRSSAEPTDASGAIHNVVGLVLMTASEQCGPSRPLLLDLALREFAGVTPATPEAYCLAQFFAGETARQLADVSGDDHHRERWLMTARTCYETAAASLPGDVVLTGGDLGQAIRVKRAIAGLLSKRPAIQRKAAEWPASEGRALDEHSCAFISCCSNPRLLYSHACMWALAQPARPDVPMLEWAAYALAVALLRDVQGGSPPSLWESAPYDDDLNALGRETVLSMEQHLTELLETTPVTAIADMDRVARIAARRAMTATERVNPG